jgi:hypothetical protein
MGRGVISVELGTLLYGARPSRLRVNMLRPYEEGVERGDYWRSPSRLRVNKLRHYKFPAAVQSVAGCGVGSGPLG